MLLDIYDVYTVLKTCSQFGRDKSLPDRSGQIKTGAQTDIMCVYLFFFLLLNCISKPSSSHL